MTNLDEILIGAWNNGIPNIYRLESYLSNYGSMMEVFQQEIRFFKKKMGERVEDNAL